MCRRHHRQDRAIYSLNTDIHARVHWKRNSLLVVSARINMDYGVYRQRLILRFIIKISDNKCCC